MWDVCLYTSCACLCIDKKIKKNWKKSKKRKKKEEKKEEKNTKDSEAFAERSSEFISVTEKTKKTRGALPPTISCWLAVACDCCAFLPCSVL